MLATVLAVLLGLGSFVFYLAAFVYPEVHRRSDFLWSALGLFYAGVLWFSAGQMTGLVLLGQIVAVVLLLGLGWQTLTVRRQKTPIYQQTPIVLTPEVVGDWAKSKLNELRIAPDETVRSVRFERRAAEDSALLSARLDPRRRPAYDYEFVEDGVAEVQQGELFADFLEKGSTEEDAASSEESSAVATELVYAAPPSAEAEVVAVEAVTEETATVETATEDADLAQTISLGNHLEESVSEESVLEEDFSSQESAEAANSTIEVDEIGVEDGFAEVDVAAKTVRDSDSRSGSSGSELKDTMVRAADMESVSDSLSGDLSGDLSGNLSGDLSDEAVAEVPKRISRADESMVVGDVVAADDFAIRAETGSAKTGSAKTREKPSLLKMPVILMGWLKDVVISLAKPKPSKPVIEIPRREPAVSSHAAVDDVAEADRRYNDEPRDDDWEESNWID